ncbi:hypothetical protein P43SY_009647 [Pythium insidiosum]|uniref:Uncharacterized protein n=1 Tax=Pythium insidiosum TaxID=114742 RepID=A0AAD5M1H1_PYTIN|nr:hypothetical protein P43SY_009647 [Pythium insidiosum]
MLSMVNTEHTSSSVPTAVAAADSFHSFANAAASDASGSVERSIPVPVLVKHEEYSAAAAAVAAVAAAAIASADHSAGEESSTSSSSVASQLSHLKSGTFSNASSPVSSADASKRQQQNKRSTKSKCPPGLRSGKWTPEEEAFTNMIIYFFKLGRLNIEDGTSLRWYLAKRLNCEAMRVTKKLKGNSSIGKQIFRALEDTEENRRAIETATKELELLERAFLDSLTATGQTTTTAAAAAAAASRSKRSSPHKPAGHLKPPHLEAKKLVVAKVKAGLANSEDAKLLLHFFTEAHDIVDAPSSAEKKRHFSDVETSASLSTNSSHTPYTSSATDDPPATKRRSVVSMSDIMSATTTSSH